MGPFDFEEKQDEIVIEKLVPDEHGNLRATLFIPVDNKQAYKLFCETFFERQVHDAHIKITYDPKKAKPA